MAAARPVPAALAFGVACAAVGTYAAMDVFMKALSIQSGAYAAVLWRSAAGLARPEARPPAGAPP